jgi:hypothetical protein
MAQLISERVTVTWRDGRLSSFWWRDHDFEVAEILSDSRRVDFESRWYLRRHRRQLVVHTQDDRFFELYAPSPGEWVLYRELDNPFAQ